MKNNYVVTVIDKATYVIKAESQNEAKERAIEWFSEREPSVVISIDDNIKEDIEI